MTAKIQLFSEIIVLKNTEKKKRNGSLFNDAIWY